MPAGAGGQKIYFWGRRWAAYITMRRCESVTSFLRRKIGTKSG